MLSSAHRLRHAWAGHGSSDAEDGEVREVEKQGTCILSITGRFGSGPAHASPTRREQVRVSAGVRWPPADRLASCSSSESQLAGRSMRACALLLHRARLACASSVSAWKFSEKVEVFGTDRSSSPRTGCSLWIPKVLGSGCKVLL